MKKARRAERGRTVQCPACQAEAGSDCKGGNADVPCRLREVLSSGHPALSVPCPACHANAEALCTHLARSVPTPLVHFHDGRDSLAYEKITGSEIPGLTYSNGMPVKRQWVLRDHVRQEDGLRVLKLRAVGTSLAWLYAASMDSHVWFGGQYMETTKRKAKRETEEIVKRIGLLDGPDRTVWSIP